MSHLEVSVTFHMRMMYPFAGPFSPKLSMESLKTRNQVSLVKYSRKGEGNGKTVLP